MCGLESATPNSRDKGQNYVITDMRISFSITARES
jgi:hypothetical protein